jgi:protein-S-isoprenylcysteine O-methyltransferase Ste14
MKYLLLCILWATWCFQHSFVASTAVTVWIKKKLGRRARYYRISYNLTSLATVIPLLYWQDTISGQIVIQLSPMLKIIKYVTLFLSAAIVAGFFLSFDIREFLGIKSEESEETAPVISRHGFYGIVRHPMYLGGCIFFIRPCNGCTPCKVSRIPDSCSLYEMIRNRFFKPDLILTEKPVSWEFFIFLIL